MVSAPRKMRIVKVRCCANTINETEALTHTYATVCIYKFLFQFLSVRFYLYLHLLELPLPHSGGVDIQDLLLMHLDSNSFHISPNPLCLSSSLI